MNPIVYITIGLLALAITAGFVYSYLVVNTNIFSKGSIQHKKYPEGHIRSRLPLIGFNLFNLFTLTFLGLHFMQGMFVIETPSVWTFTWQFVFVLFLDDAYFYFYHRYMHINKWFYRKLHLKHHQATAPFPMEFIYNHPLEWIGGTPGLIFAYIIIYQIEPINAYAFWSYSFFRNWHELEIHSGLKSTIGKYIPFYGTVEHHDYHHSKVHGNYASTLTLWDKIFGTEVGEKDKDVIPQ